MNIERRRGPCTPISAVCRLFQTNNTHELWLMFQYAKLLSNNHDLRSFGVSDEMRYKVTMYHDLLVRLFWRLQRRFATRQLPEIVSDESIAETAAVKIDVSPGVIQSATENMEWTQELNNFIFETYCLQYIDGSSLQWHVH